MKHGILLLSLIATSFACFAQKNDTQFRISWNKQLLLQKNSLAIKDTPVVKIKNIWLGKNTPLPVYFKQGEKRTGWKRTFQFTDILNNVVFQRVFDSTEGNFNFTTSDIKPFLQKHRRMLLYTFQQPENSMLNGIRTERYLLCKLILE